MSVAKGELMIIGILAAGAVAAVDNSQFQFETRGQAHRQVTAPGGGRPEAGPPGALLFDRSPQKSVGQPTFLTGKPGEDNGLHGSPRQAAATATYKPKVWLGPDVPQPSIEEIRRQVKEKLGSASGK